MDKQSTGAVIDLTEKTADMIAKGDPNALSLLLFLLFVVCVIGLCVICYIFYKFMSKQLKDKEEEHSNLRATHDKTVESYGNKLEGFIKEISESQNKAQLEAARTNQNIITQLTSITSSVSQVLGYLSANSDFHRRGYKTRDTDREPS